MAPTMHQRRSGERTEPYAARSFRRPLEPVTCGRSLGREMSREERVSMNNLGAMPDVSLEVFLTCTQSTDGDREAYVQRVADVAGWSERGGCQGVFGDFGNRLGDGWVGSRL